MHKILIFYLLFHHNQNLFCFIFRKCIILFISASMKGIIFRLEKFEGNETFRTEVEFPFPVCQMFNFPVIVMKKLLKAMAIFVDPLIFLHSQVWWEPVPLNVLFLYLSLFCSICFYFVIRFCCKSSA